MNGRPFLNFVSKPWGLFVVLMLLIAAANLLLILLLREMNLAGSISAMQHDILNIILLALIIAPTLYFLVIRKMQQHLAEKNRITAELEHHQRDLEQMVQERTEALENAKRLAEAANLDKSRFLAEIGHEIRTPMNAIIGWNYLLLKEIADPKYQLQLTKMGEAANHLLKVINHMIDLSRIESGQYVLEASDFILPDMIDQIVARMDDMAFEKGLQLKVEFDPEIPAQLHADSLRLGQILVNFITNAIRFSDEGEIIVRVKLMDEVAQRVLVRIEVEDHGIGMSDEQQAQLFQRYKQADANQMRGMGSTGLGLIITRQLVTLMGGEVGVHSKQGAGSTFWMTAYMGKVAPKSRLTDAAKTLLIDHPMSVLLEHYRGVRVLLAEDDPFNQEMTIELLKSVGMQVDLAENGQIAADKVKANDYALVIMDIQMPVMDGLAATRLIRQMPGKGELPILSLTANASDDDRNQCMNAGMSDYISKPVDPDELYSILLFWLRKSGS